MSPRSFGYLSSEPFEIKSSDRSYFIHGDILAAQLKKLDTINTDGSKKIDLSWLSSNIVELFAEFLYTKDYQIPEPPISDGDETETETEDGEIRDRTNTPDTVQSSMGHDEAARGGVNTSDTVQGSGSRVVGANLMIHAGLYELGQHTGVEPLKEMALGRLKTALDRMNEHMSTPQVMANFIELLDYLCNHMYFNGTTSEEIKDLISTFAAENFEKLVNQKETAYLWGEEGDLEFGLIMKVGRKLGQIRGLLDVKDSTILEKSQELEVVNAKRRELEVKVQWLEDSVKRVLEVKTANAERLRDLGADNAAKIRGLEAINAINVQKMMDANMKQIRQYEAGLLKAQAIYLDSDQLRALKMDNATKMRELEISYAEKVRLLKSSSAAEMQDLEAKLAEDFLIYVREQVCIIENST